MKRFDSEYNGMYIVVFNGSEIKKVFNKKLPALRAAIRYSVVRSRYVELWYQDLSGDAHLLEFFN